MKFEKNIVEYSIAGIPLIGNLTTGYTIGLTKRAKELCHKAFLEDIPDEEFKSLDKNLYTSIKTKLANPNYPLPKTDAYIHVTNNCNLECRGCYSASSSDIHVADISYKRLCMALDSISERIDKLIISGGEPFLRKDLAKIVHHAYCNCKIHSITILSNGTAINSADLHALKPYLECISISIDAWPKNTAPSIRGTNSFDQILRSIDLIKKAQIPLHFVSIITPLNYLHLKDFILFANRHHATISFSLLSPTPNSKLDEDLKFTHNQLVELGRIIASNLDYASKNQSFMDAAFPKSISTINRCGIGTKTITIGSDGYIYPCHLLYSQKYKMPLNAEYEISCDKYPSVEEIPECKPCPYKYVCGGGCRARALNEYGSVKRKDPYCAFIKEFYRIRFSELAISIQNGGE